MEGKLEGRRWVAISVLIVLTAVASLAPSAGAAGVDWEIITTLDLEKEPLDTALSPDGRMLFVLTDGGEILVYSTGRTPMYRIPVGVDVDQIKVGPGGNVLVLGSRKDRKVRIISLSYIQDINLSGSPFKGEAEAAIAVAAFNDFQ